MGPAAEGAHDQVATGAEDAGAELELSRVQVGVALAQPGELGPVHGLGGLAR